MKRTITSGLIAVATSVLLAGSAHAQVPNSSAFSLEVRGGGVFPQAEFGDAVDTGLGLSGSVTFQALPMLGIYAGYARHSFDIKEEIIEAFEQEFGEELGGATIVISGPRAGVRLSIPTPLMFIDPFVEAGAFYGRPEFKFEDLEDGGEGDAESELGFEASAGVGFNVLPRVQLTPAVGYTRLSFDEDDSNFFAASIGLRIRL